MTPQFMGLINGKCPTHAGHVLVRFRVAMTNGTPVRALFAVRKDGAKGRPHSGPSSGARARSPATLPRAARRSRTVSPGSRRRDSRTLGPDHYEFQADGDGTSEPRSVVLENLVRTRQRQRLHLSTPSRERCHTPTDQTHRTRPARPQTSGKAERFIQALLREWAYARLYSSSDERATTLPTWTNHYNYRRPHGTTTSHHQTTE